jgi:putative PIN family toxin of toxin-antitoxin system
MRAVLDANVFVSALLVELGAPWAVLDSWRRGEFELVTTPELLAELRDVFARPSISRRLIEAPDATLQRIVNVALQVRAVQRLDVIVDDPSDNRLLEAAIAGDADFIVSGDRHLLSLASYADVAIVTPARFAAILAEQRSG